jgi:hypothetical protein
MAQFVKEDENAEHHDEGGDGANEIGENMRHRTASFRSHEWGRRFGGFVQAAFAVANSPAARRASSSRAIT